MASQNRPTNFREGQRQSSSQYCVHSMTERQLDAYFAARDTIRRIQRTSSLVFPAFSARQGDLRPNRH
jgi:hypothetical protein